MRLGLIVNPVAGTGGPLALKGSDDIALAAAPADDSPGHAERRAIRALAGCTGRLLVPDDTMGARAARLAGIAVDCVHSPGRPSRSADTVAAVAALEAAGADLILFAGGDGTARDVLAAAPGVPVLGIPAGVKMHSGVFATSPAAVAATLRHLAAGGQLATTPAEVVDRDESGAPRLYGTLIVPAEAPRQPAKAIAAAAPDAALGAAVARAARELADTELALIGPGMTMFALKTALTGKGSLLGIDIVARGVLAAADADEATLWDLVQGRTPRLLLGVIGGQGFLLGRGNQQLSPRVLARTLWPPEILASAAKLVALPGGRLLVDTGDEALDRRLAGHVAVRTGPRVSMMMRIDAA